MVLKTKLGEKNMTLRDAFKTSLLVSSTSPLYVSENPAVTQKSRDVSFGLGPKEA